MHRTLNLTTLALLACCTSMTAMEETSKEFFNEPPLVAQSGSALNLAGGVSANNEYIADRYGPTCFSGETVQLYSPHTGALSRKKFQHPKFVMHAVFSPCGRMLATAALDGVVRLWRIKSGRCIATHNVGNMDSRDFLAFSPNGTHLAFGNWWEIIIWPTRGPNTSCMRYKTQGAQVCGGFIDENTFAYAWWGKVDVDFGYGFIEPRGRSCVRIIDTQTGTQKAEMLCDSSFIECFAQASSKPHIIAAMTRYNIWLWDTQKKPPARPLHLIPDDRKRFDSVEFAPRADYLIAGTDMSSHSLLLYQLNAQRTAATLVWRHQVRTGYPISHPNCAGGGRSIVSIDGNSGTILWNLSEEFQAKLALPRTSTHTDAARLRLLLLGDVRQKPIHTQRLRQKSPASNGPWNRKLHVREGHRQCKQNCR